MDFAPPFGRWLKQRRMELDLTQADLARRAGYSIFAVRKIESGYIRPSREMAERLAIVLGIAADSGDEFIAFARGVEFPHPVRNLPAPPTPLLGRANDVAAARHALERADVRLLTLTGAPGVGKTRLAIEVARAISPAFADGVCFIALASIGDPALVGAGLAEALGLRVPEDADRPVTERLKQHLRGMHLLLVLDNFEHLLPAAPLVAELLAAAPRLKVLATSRAALNLSAEHTYAVPPLALPDLDHFDSAEALANFPAVELFAQRAQAVKPSFTLATAGAPAVAAICCRLDGLPLAIELAAARVRLFTPQTLYARLDHHVGSALRLLTGGPRDLPARQQTLRATIDWSYHLLSAEEKRLFRRMGVFVGSYMLEAAQAVCAECDERLENGDSGLESGQAPLSDQAREPVSPSPVGESLITNLQSLVDQSLVQQVERSDGEPRFAMLETVREYALERLDESDETARVRDRHMAYFTYLAEGSTFGGPDAAALTWAKRFDADYANLRAAITWSQGEQADALMSLRLVVGLTWFWISREGTQGHYQGMVEMRGWVERALTRCPEAPPRLRVLALHRIAWCTGMNGDMPRGMELMEQALALCRELGDRSDLIMIPLYAVGVGAYWQGDYQRAQSLINEYLRLARELGLQPDVGAGLGMLGLLALARGDAGGAVGLLEEALRIARDLGLKSGPTRTGYLEDSLRDLSVARLQTGDFRTSAALSEEALALAEEVGDLHGAARSGLCLGYALLAQGEVERARTFMRDSLRQYRDFGSVQGILICMAGLSEVSYVLGDLRASTVLAGAAAAHLATLDSRMPPMKPLLPLCECILATAHSRLASPELASAWAEGQTMTLDQAAQYALGEDEN